jgi:hypothetical protein
MTGNFLKNIAVHQKEVEKLCIQQQKTVKGK